jgi:hypothetical protein
MHGILLYDSFSKVCLCVLCGLSEVVSELGSGVRSAVGLRL